jgi:hypothetical protein
MFKTGAFGGLGIYRPPEKNSDCHADEVNFLLCLLFIIINI